MKETSFEVLIDTSAWIEFLRPQGDPKIGERVQGHVREGRACYTEMVILELWNGARGNDEKRFLKEMQDALIFLSTGEGVWQRAYRVARVCREAGYTVPATDILIYSVAAAHKLELDHNDAHFDQIAKVAKERL